MSTILEISLGWCVFIMHLKMIWEKMRDDSSGGNVSNSIVLERVVRFQCVILWLFQDACIFGLLKMISHSFVALHCPILKSVRKHTSSKRFKMESRNTMPREKP